MKDSGGHMQSRTPQSGNISETMLDKDATTGH